MSLLKIAAPVLVLAVVSVAAVAAVAAVASGPTGVVTTEEAAQTLTSLRSD